jgi:benzoyl-CoA reductase/2-hydroxyglutaryl-CoA dehydratase subunit BcrC/BadD/HgdB
LDSLRYHYAHRLAAAREAHARGTRVVGLVGNTIPRELVRARGYYAVLIAAQPDAPTPVADVYMEDVISPETKSLFELATGGELEFLDLLVLSRPYVQLYYYLKEVYRLGRAPRLPALHMFDLMQSQREAVRTYNERQLASLIERLECISGGGQRLSYSKPRSAEAPSQPASGQRLSYSEPRSAEAPSQPASGQRLSYSEPRSAEAPSQPASGQRVSGADVGSAIELSNRVRALQRQLIALRWQRTLSGVDALQALGAGYFMAPSTYAEALAEHVAQLRPEPDFARRPRLMVLASEPLSHLALHRALEAAGALVIAEDDWWGSRAPGTDIATEGPPDAAILGKYWRDAASSQVTPADAREAWFRANAVRDEVDGVAFYLPPSDRQLGWDYPRLKAWLSEHGKPSILLRSDAADQLQQQLGAWLETLVPSPAAARHPLPVGEGWGEGT